VIFLLPITLYMSFRTEFIIAIAIINEVRNPLKFGSK